MFAINSPFQNSFLGGASPLTGPSGLGAQNPMMNMLAMMQMMMGMMQLVMSSTLGSNVFSQSPAQFGGAPGVGGGSPLTSFLGGNSGSSGAGTSPVSGGSFAPPSDGTTSGKTQDFINKALAKQGAPYVFGAAGNGKYDCSGLIHASLNEAGVKGPRLTARGYQDKYKNSRVAKEDLKPGDLVFFHSKNDRGIPAGQATHVEIYLGNGKTMGTDSPKEGARVEPIDWSTFIGGARVPELA